MKRTLLVLTIVSLIGCADLVVPQIDIGPQVLDQLPLRPDAKEEAEPSAEEEPLTLLEALAGVNPASDAVVLDLIDTRKGINEKDYDGWTPLHYVASERSLAIIKALVTAGAKTGVGDDWDDLPRDEVEDNDELSKAEKQEARVLLGGN